MMTITPLSNQVIGKINENGGNIYLVGGAVRDWMLGEKPTDFDFCVTGIKQDKFEELFPKAKLVGKDFPVYLLNGNEIAFARTERKTAKGHKGFEVNFNPDVTIEEDLERRDLTINSMAVNLINGRLVDPFDGRKDIVNKILRPTSKAFKEDPLRVYRVARFAAQLDFKVCETLKRYMNYLKNELIELPIERVFEEIRKVLSTDNPRIFFDVLKNTNVLNVHFDKIAKAEKIPQVKKHHPEGNVYEHLMQTLQEISKLSDKEDLRFAMLYHDIGKVKTPKENLPHHYKHCKFGEKILLDLNRKIIIPNKWFRTTRLIITEHMRITDWKEMGYGKLVRLFKKIKRSPITIEDMVKVVKADKLGRNNKNEKVTCMNGICKLYHRLFNETGGEDIDSDRYSGEKFGQQLFQYRCHWIKRERNKILKEVG